MEIQQGRPTVNGRYVAFIADRIYKLWATPTIAVFHDGRWDIGRPVFAWLGPLPTGKIEDLWPIENVGRFEPIEYDL